MATYSRIQGNTATAALGLQSPSSNYGAREVVVENIIDFSATGNAHAAGDVFNLINVPAGYSLGVVGAEVLVADTAGNSGTIQMKVGATAEGSAVAPTATGFLASEGVVTNVAPAGTQAYVTATIATGAINAVVRFYVVLRKLKGKIGGLVAIGSTTNPAGQTVTQYRAMSTTELTNLIQ